MQELIASGEWLPLIFMVLTGVAVLAYVILDGYDLGVGMLTGFAEEHERDVMIASIGPFWDANETWLVLAAGLILVAFPAAHGIILGALYIPTAVMLGGLILRGVAFDFRAKAHEQHKTLWDRCFLTGSVIAGLSQGYMLGKYILGFDDGAAAEIFGLLCGLCLCAGYTLLGACWLILKTENELQRKAVGWARPALRVTGLGMGLISVVTPMESERIFDKWFSIPEMLFLAPVPLAAAVLLVKTELLLRRLPLPGDKLAWAPLASAVGLFALCFCGLGYSFYPYIVPGHMTFVQAASDKESLLVMLAGGLLTLPCIFGYTIYSYRVFGGKTRGLSYE